MRNRLKYYRHLLQFDEQKDFAEFLGFSAWSVNRWEGQKTQPDAESLYKIFLRLRERIPDVHMEDLISPD